MSTLQRILLHVTAFYILVNGGLLLANWFADANPYKDGFPLFTGIFSLVLGLATFVISFLKSEKKEK